jgi:hypothetical protein
VVFLRTVTQKDTRTLAQITPVKGLAATIVTTSEKRYEVIDMQDNSISLIPFYGAGTAISPKLFDVVAGGTPFGPLPQSAYYVMPQKGGTTLWFGGSDDVFFPGELNTQMWRGTGTPLVLSKTRTIASVPKTMDIFGLEAEPYQEFDPILLEPGNKAGFRTAVITGTIALQVTQTTQASLGIVGEVREFGDPEGEILVPGTMRYGVELVRRLLKGLKYAENT